MHRTIARAALVCAAAGAGLALWSATEDTAAHAADHRPPVEQPGGLLDHTVRLPEQAAARAKAAVEQVKEPAPEPVPTTPAPADVPPLEVPPPVVVETSPADAPPAPPPVAEVPPTPAPTTPVALPSTGPIPLPDADDNTTPQSSRDPLTELVPAIVIPARPPALGPVPPAGAVDQLVTALAAADPAERAYCADDALNVGRDAIAELVASLIDPSSAPRARPAPGCPGRPGHQLPTGADTTGPAVSGGTGAGGTSLSADLPGSLTSPALIRLAHARPRSNIPAGHSVHPEPRPT